MKLEVLRSEKRAPDGSLRTRILNPMVPDGEMMIFLRMISWIGSNTVTLSPVGSMLWMK